MELTFMQETTASGFLFTTFDTFDNRNSITQTGTVHASSGKLFNRHLKLTSYFFKKVINVKVKVKYIILNGFAKNSRVKKKYHIILLIYHKELYDYKKIWRSGST